MTLTISPIVEESIARADSYGDGDGEEISGYGGGRASMDGDGDLAYVEELVVLCFSVPLMTWCLHKIYSIRLYGSTDIWYGGEYRELLSYNSSLSMLLIGFKGWLTWDNFHLVIIPCFAHISSMICPYLHRK
jgi:hypothetical protein